MKQKFRKRSRQKKKFHVKLTVATKEEQMQVPVSEPVMRTIAKWCVLRCLAPAKEQFAILFGGVFHRLKAGTFVRPVAEGLIGRLPACAPEIGFAVCHIDGEGGLLRDFGQVGHWAIPLQVCCRA